MKTKYDFNGQKVVITGGASGIGFEVANQFLKTGATVYIWDAPMDTYFNSSADIPFTLAILLGVQMGPDLLRLAVPGKVRFSSGIHGITLSSTALMRTQSSLPP